MGLSECCRTRWIAVVDSSRVGGHQGGRGKGRKRPGLLAPLCFFLLTRALNSPLGSLLPARRDASRVVSSLDEIIWRRAERNRRWPIVRVGRETARGRFLVGEPVAMRRPAQVPLDRMRFPANACGRVEDR